MSTATASQMLVHSKYRSLPTITRSGVDIVQQGKHKQVTTEGCTKLCVLPPSTRTVTRWLGKRPAKWPESEFKLIWAWYGSGLSGRSGVGCGSPCSILGKEGLSFSPMSRRTQEVQRCPLWYFSSQLKHNPCSRHEVSSSGVRCFTGGGGGRGGDDKRGGSGVER